MGDKEIVDFYQVGNSVYATAKHFGITDYTTRKILKKNDVKLENHIRRAKHFVYLRKIAEDANNGVKECSFCKQKKAFECFAKCKKVPDGLGRVCRNCDNARKREYRVNNKDRAKQYRLWREYGITINQYKLILDTQGQKCAICGTEKKAEGKMLHVDHDHKTGYIRGILCSDCNRGLGFFKDNRSAFLSAVTYLTKPPAFEVLGINETFTEDYVWAS